MSTRDRVKLTAHERQQIAGMEAALAASDPALAQVLKGEEGQAPAPAPSTSSTRQKLASRLRKRAGSTGPAPTSVPRSSRTALWSRTVSRACARSLVWSWTGLVLVLLGAALIGTGAGLVNLNWLSVPGAAMVGVGCGLGIMAVRRSRVMRQGASPARALPEAHPGASTYSG
ncbi:MAG TPA: hypothetical protein VFN61_00935 [Acidimicrobiales bacterium]|nr:hypothetical protein [Acidimicrobiales bacterium]